MFSEITIAERATRIGASEVAAVLDLSPWKSPWELWAEKTGRLEPDKGNKSTYLGQRFEGGVLDIAEEELGALERDVLCWADGVDFPLASTLDSRIIASGVPCEAKTSGLAGPIYGQWGDENTDQVPETYLVQVSVQMLCSGSDFAHLYALLGGRGVVRYRVARDEEVLAEIIERCSRWWDRHIVKGLEPTLTEPIPLEILKRFRRQPEKTIDLDADAVQLVAEYESLKAVKSAGEKAAEVAQAKLIALLGDAEAGTLPDGRLVKYMEQTRKGYVVNETSFRTLRITKGK